MSCESRSKAEVGGRGGGGEVGAEAVDRGSGQRQWTEEEGLSVAEAEARGKGRCRGERREALGGERQLTGVNARLDC